MVFESSDLAGVANVALRALQNQVRQTDAATPTSSNTPQPSQSDGGNGGQGQNSGGGSGSSPLLFFVALGFGVVFTNLW